MSIAARPQVLQGCQLGLESTPGTAVSASVRLTSSYVEFQPSTPITQYRSAGAKSPTQETRGRRHTPFTVEGQLSYIDLAYWLSGMLEDPLAGGSPFTLNFQQFASDTPQTFTLETGIQGGAGEKADYCVISGIRMRFTQEECTFSAEGFGRELTNPATLTGSPTELTRAPISPNDWDFYVGTSIAGIAEVTGAVHAVEVSLSNFWLPVFAANSAEDSFSKVTAGAPEITWTVTYEETSSVAAYQANQVSLDDFYLRLQAPGPNSMDLRLQSPAIIRSYQLGSSQGVRTMVITYGAKFDGTGGSNQGNAFEAIVTNGLANL